MLNAVEFEKISFKWQLNWKVCGFSLFFFPLTLGLGFWQLDRAEQKRTIQQSLQAQQDLPPIKIHSEQDLANMESDRLHFREVSLFGAFDGEHVWVLENKVLQGRLGVHIVQPFLLRDNVAVLVDRGWVPLGPDRTSVPQLNDLSSVADTVRGRLVKPTQNTLLNDQVIEGRWPRRILQITPVQLAEQLENTLLPWVLQIEPEDPSAYTAVWSATTMPARKHLGYAVQWFSMALALAVLTLYANSNFHVYTKSIWSHKRR